MRSFGNLSTLNILNEASRSVYKSRYIKSAKIGSNSTITLNNGHSFVHGL
ncbi:hypothetical protein M5D96_005969 [Drosophila gunungcola]|uniref:Uncharacterized protein n=1 Tax=Drosophila gunungcola TaxID=103775 RepID=A0A9Q0BR61_9MUSC|nr:hypothetical protein M5D96_005969 [Drosophila gunungcola]